MTTPLISICVPVYNGARYLGDCFESIAGQTFTDFEVLVVDDGSRDDSLAITKAWADTDPRFTLHANAHNLGLVGNWNRCIELARGKWIKFLFQDDLMEPECLAALLKAGEGGEGFAACARSLIFEGFVGPEALDWFDRHERLLKGIYKTSGHLGAEAYSTAKLSTVGWNIVGEPSVTLIARDLFQRYGSFDPLLVHLCDSEMWNRLGSNVGVCWVEQKLVSFRIHPASASTANHKRRFRSGVIDELVELHRLCHAPQLAPFRQNARESRRLNGLYRLWIRKVVGAIRYARGAASQSPPDYGPALELRSVLQQLPGVGARLSVLLQDVSCRVPVSARSAA